MAYTINWDAGDNKDYLKRLLKEVFDSSDREALVEYKEVTRVLTSEDEYERFARHVGLGLASPITDGQDIPLDEPVYGTTKDIEQNRIGLGFKITSGMKKFNKWYNVEELTKDLKMTMKESMDIDIAKMFNNLTATTYASGFDGLAIASASHTILGSSTTYSNYASASLGVTALKNAMIYFDTLIDDQGQTFTVIPNKLIVHPDERFTAYELLGGPNMPLEMSNTINSMVKDYELTPFVYHRSTSSTFWAVAATGHRKYGLVSIITQEPDIKVFDSPDTSRSIDVTSEAWYNYGCLDPRLIYVGNV